MSNILKTQTQTQIQSTNSDKKKSEYIELEHKLNQQIKNNQKQAKKLTELQDEIKKMRTEKIGTEKEITFLISNLERMRTEAMKNNKTIEDNKILIRKMEGKLVQNVKNQNLVELNHKLNEEIEGFDLKMSIKEKEISDLKMEISKLGIENKSLNKALEVRVDGFNTTSKFQNNLKTNILLDIGRIKTELEAVKEKEDTLERENKKLSIEKDEYLEKIKELTYGKTYLTELLVETETRLQKKIEENSEMKEYVLSINKEKQILEDLMGRVTYENEELRKEINNKIGKYEWESKEFKQKAESLSKENERNKEVVQIFERKLNESREEINKLEEENFKMRLKEKENISLIKSLTAKNAIIENENTKNLTEKIELEEKIEGLLIKINEIKKEKSDLFERNRILESSQTQTETDVIAENKRLELNEKVLKEKLDSLEKTILKYESENEKLRKQFNEAVDLISSLRKDKESLIEDNEQKGGIIESMKKNMKMSKFSLGKEKDEKYEKERGVDDEVCIKEKVNMGISQKETENSSLISLIRKEKEKNSNLLEEIKKMKKTLIN